LQLRLRLLTPGAGREASVDLKDVGCALVERFRIR
jgi:hypothetical protein